MFRKPTFCREFLLSPLLISIYSTHYDYDCIIGNLLIPIESRTCHPSTTMTLLVVWAVTRYTHGPWQPMEEVTSFRMKCLIQDLGTQSLSIEFI